MRVSRRIFLGAVGSAVLARGGARIRPTCVVVDLGCVLDESLAGFKRQVGDLPYEEEDVVIVPGVGSLTEEGRRAIRRFLSRGATVLLEYGAGARNVRDTYFPYVEYFWPVRMKIREFAPVRLQPGPQDEVIATFDGQPVGLRRRAGSGTLVTIGSPLGPVFLTGDPDAGIWLDALIQQHSLKQKTMESRPL
jgi:hypothetical protein